MKHNSVEIKSAISEAVKECRAIVDTCKTELRELTEEEQVRFDELKKEIEDKKTELQELQKELDAIEIPTEEVEEEKEEQKENVEEDEDKDKNNNLRNMKKEKFSLLGAIRSVVNNTPMSEINKAVIAEGAKDFRNAGVTSQGQIQLPAEQRAAITVAAEGEDIVATDVYDVVTPLRAENVLAAAGAKFLTGLQGDVQIPVMSAENVAWAGETAAATDGAGTFTNVKLSPKRLTAYIDLSKQFILQDGAGAEEAIRQDLIAAINDKLEATILGEGAGDANTPAGIFNGKDVKQIKAFGDITALEAELENANVKDGRYIVNPKAKAVMRAMSKGTKSTQLLYENDEIDGTPALVSTNVAADKLVFGDFKNLVIGAWGAVDLIVDPYTQAANGMVRIVINCYFDAKTARNEAFACGTTAIA